MRYVILLALLPICAFAQETVPPTFLDGILAWISGPSAGAVATILAVLAEAGLRFFPSAKPLSLLIPAKYVLDGTGKLAVWLSGLLQIVIDTANRVKPV